MVEVLQYTGSNRNEVLDFCSTCYFTLHGHVKDLLIDPLESDEVVCINDFIVRTVTGRFVVYTPEAFIATFENI